MAIVVVHNLAMSSPPKGSNTPLESCTLESTELSNSEDNQSFTGIPQSLDSRIQASHTHLSSTSDPSSPPWSCDNLPAAQKYLPVLLRFIMALLIVVALMFIYWHDSVIDHYGSCLRQNYSEEFYNRYNDRKYYKIPTGISEPKYMPYLPLISIIMKNSSKEYAEWLHIADIDEVQGSGEENVRIDDILRPVSEEKLRLVLIEGEPGIGKSTLAIELVSRWVKQSDENLNRFEIVIFIQLRSETYHNVKSIEDLFVVDKKINMKNLMVEIENRKGADILWILDGLDELPSHLSQDSVFVQLIKGEISILLESTVIVTSRHSAISGLHYGLDRKRTKHINIKGFNDTSIQQYATKYFNNKEMMEAFQIYYKGNPMIESMLQVPLTCNIVCLIFDDTYQHDNKPYPKKMTTLYNQYVRMLLRRHLIEARVIEYNYMMPQHLILEADFNISELANISQDFFSLSKLAFDGVIKQMYIFGEESNSVDKLSMMDTIVSFYRHDEVKSSSFLHATLQEYLAAIYLVNNGGPNSTTLKKNLYCSNFGNVLTFYVGLLRIINLEVDNLTSDALQCIKRTTFKDKYHDLLLVKEKNHVQLYVYTFLQRCIYEHNSLKYHLDMQFEDYTIYLNQVFSGPCDIASDYDYFISGFLVAAYSHTYRVFFYSLQELKSFNKGLLYQSSVVRGSLEIVLNFNANNDFEELLKIPEHVPTVLILQFFLVNFQNISKLFLNLQLLILGITDCLLCGFNLADHPLLKLNKLNTLVLSIDPQNFNDSDLEVLKELTAPGRPLRNLQVESYSEMSYNDKVMALIRQNTSLEELGIIVRFRPSKERVHSRIRYFPSNKSLHITCELEDLAFIEASLPPIKLAYINNLIVGTTRCNGTNSTLGETFSKRNNFQYNFFHNITVYSKLMLIEPRPLLSSQFPQEFFQLQHMKIELTLIAIYYSIKALEIAMNITHKCYKVSQGKESLNESLNDLLINAILSIKTYGMALNSFNKCYKVSQGNFIYAEISYFYY